MREQARRRLWLLARGYGQVLPVGVSQAAIAEHWYPLAFGAGFAISALWWLNAGTAGRRDITAADACCYGLGAALGTVCGAALVPWLRGVW